MSDTSSLRGVDKSMDTHAARKVMSCVNEALDTLLADVSLIPPFVILVELCMLMANIIAYSCIVHA